MEPQLLEEECWDLVPGGLSRKVRARSQPWLVPALGRAGRWVVSVAVAVVVVVAAAAAAAAVVVVEGGEVGQGWEVEVEKLLASLLGYILL